jgi:hypothetical protein
MYERAGERQTPCRVRKMVVSTIVAMEIGGWDGDSGMGEEVENGGKGTVVRKW